MTQPESVRVMTESRFDWVADPRATSVIWTASLSAPAISNGTLVSRYRKIVTTCDWRVELTAGALTTFGSGQWQFTLPYTPNVPSGAPLSIGACIDSSTGNRYAVYGTLSSTTLNLQGVAASFPTANLTASSIFTWAVGDALSFQITYETT